MKSRSMSSCEPVSRWKKSLPWNRKNKAQLLPMTLLSPKLTLLLQMARRWPLLYLANAAVFISLIRLPVSHGGYRTDGRYCGRNFTCGRLTNLNFPFWLDSATNSDADQFCKVPGFGLRRCNDSDLDPLIKLQGNWFRVLQVNQSDSGGSIRVAHQELWESFCPFNFWYEMNLDGSNLLSYSEKNRNLIIFHNCWNNAVANFPPEHILTCGGEVALWVNNSVSERPDGCRWGVSLQVNGMAYDALLHRNINLLDALKVGFDLNFDSDDIFCYTCESDFAGKCERDSDSVQPPKCKPRGSQFSHLKRLGGAIIVVTVATSLTLLLVYCFLKKMMQNSYWEIEAFITRQATNSTPKRFSFSEVKKITKSLNEKLGQGGYGAVYKGKLPDGRHVAVKILNVSNGNGQDFINEVASISRTSHINVVTLLGFCLEAKKRALIYEFMPNGSLDKFIYNGKKTTLEGNLILGWEILYRIAIGVAKGLEYLHNGCNTRIVHFDIKPHNILLDENLCPKISDFGLAKLCTRRESIVSLLDARGTIGYIAPEVFSRTFGNISHKSDVYSYGMMVLEMAGGRKNIDVGVSHTSEVYFPTWIYQQLVLEGEFKVQGTITFEESEIARKMMIVGLWCIQTNPSDRPSISKVIEMLEGRVDVLQIPPKPYLSSPPKAQPDCTFSSTS